MVGNLPEALRSWDQRLVQARLASFMSQYQVSVSERPCAVCKPRALTSLANTSRPASFCPPLTLPNSAACLLELIVSPPALASPITFAVDDCSCSKNDEKSAVFSGGRAGPTAGPPGGAAAARV